MYSIYFGDKEGKLASFDSSYLSVERVYKYNTKLIIPYDKADVYDIGDTLIGKDFLICITYENINLLESSYYWSEYLYCICDLLNWDKTKRLKIYTNNNNLMFPHTSIGTLNSILTDTLDVLQEQFTLVEVC